MGKHTTSFGLKIKEMKIPLVCRSWTQKKRPQRESRLVGLVVCESAKKHTIPWQI